MSVEPQSMSALDVAVFMDRRDSNRMVRKICEYRWATKDSVSMEEAGGPHYLIFDVFDGTMNAEILKESKVISGYAERNMLTIQRAIAEFKRRSRFLSSMAEGNAKADDYVKGCDDHGK
jgi:hypothetical protein